MEVKDPALNLWPEFAICGTYPYSQKMCNGFSKLYRVIFDNHLDAVGTFDVVLLYSFVIIFLAFLAIAMLTIFEKDQKSLQQIKEKVRHSTAVIAQLAATLWAIKETKFKSISPEGYKRIKENKDTMIALQKPPPPIELNIPQDSPEKPKESKKKVFRGFKPMKREFSPPQAKGAPFPYLKKTKLSPQKKASSLSNVQGKKSKTLRAVSSATSLNKKQREADTPRSVSESMSTRNVSPNTKVGKKAQIGDTVK